MYLLVCVPVGGAGVLHIKCVEVRGQPKGVVRDTGSEH